jgi:hypothetical protein
MEANPGGCPSGQRERSVKSPAKPTEVRILPLPPAETPPKHKTAGAMPPYGRQGCPPLALGLTLGESAAAISAPILKCIVVASVPFSLSLRMSNPFTYRI